MIPGPDQLKLVPDVVAPESVTAVVVHVSVPPVALAPGGVALELTDANAVLVQPFAELVIVTVYVPVELTVGLAVDPPDMIPGPDHLKLVPDAVPAERMTEVAVHVSVPPVALAPGGVVFVFTAAVAVLVQPFAELVIVTVYVPLAVTVGLAVDPPDMIPGPDQLKLVLDVVAAESMTAVIVHVSVPPVALAAGGVASELTDAVAVLVQPFAELVIVTVYVPLALTVGLAVDPPDIIPDPAQLKLEPDVVAAESMTAVIVHVSVPPVALAPGGVALELTGVVAVLVQPPEDALTVTV
jgi:hypothetical protein